MAVKTIILTTTGYSSWTVPQDWTSTNTIRVIGGGAGGSRVTNNTTTGGGGGGGGGFSSISNITLTPGTVLTTFIGAGGSGGTTSGSIGGAGSNTWINTAGANAVPTSTSNGALALGAAAPASTTAGGAAASTTGAIGTVTFAGGAGNTGATTARGGGGGGGSAGSNARAGFAGSIGINSAAGGGGGGGGTGGAAAVGSTTTGGVGGINYSQTAGTGGSAGAGGGNGQAGSNGAGGGGGGGTSTLGATAGLGGAGGAGTEYTITAGGTAGSGGGGGGGGGASSTSPGSTGGAGGAGGNYGGGGGGGGSGLVSGNGGNGGNGAIIITYTQTSNRYWVGGTGTWDGSTTTNWSYVSGGAGGADAPTAAEDVFFNASSDSSAPFTVTVSGGLAACRSLTVSGLDNTMTLAGSGALNVAGSLSVPSTNFTQSYTGTITFSATSSQIITTSGKSFTAFTFNGVGGTWTLQDALTLTGAATLTNGTIDYNSKTFTMSNFSSNNSNTRKIQTTGAGGKIVTTSGSTIWTTTTTTGLTTDGNVSVQCTGSVTASTISPGALSESSAISFQISLTSSGGGGGGVNITLTSGSSVRNLSFDNNSYTIQNNSLTIYGNLTVGSSGSASNITLSGGANVWTFATSGTQTITTNGATLDFPITFSGTGTYSLQDNMTVGVLASVTLRTVTLTTGTLELNSRTLTLYGTFAASGTGTRKIQMSGSGGKIVLNSDQGGTVWSNATVTGMTTDGNVLVQLSVGAGGTISAGAMTEASNPVSFQLSPTASGTIAFTASNTVKNLTIDSAAFTLSNIAITLYGNLTIASTTPTLTAGTNAWTFAGTTGTQTITTNGKTLDFPITFSGTGTYSLGGALSVGTSTSRTITHTSGTFDLNGYTVTVYGIFNTNNSNVRTLAFGSTGKIVLTLGGIAAFTVATPTNLTVTGTNPLIQVTGADAVNTTTITSSNTVLETNTISVQLSQATTSNTTITGRIRNLTIDNKPITLNNASLTIFGNFTVAGTTPVLAAGASSVTFASTSGTKTINLNGNASNVIDFPITFDGAGGTWQLQHNLTIGSTASRTVTLTNGTIDLNNFIFTIYGAFVSSTSNNRGISFGIGKIVLSLDGTTATTIWNVAGGATFTSSGNQLVEVTGSGTLVRTIIGGTLITEANAISFSILTTAGTVTFSNNSILKDIIINCAGTTVNYNNHTLYGSFIFTAGTSGTTGTLTFSATSGTKTINPGSTTMGGVVLDGVGGTFVLGSNLTSTGSITLTNGTFSAVTYNINATSFISSNANVRTLNMGTGTWTLSTNTFWNIQDGTNLTLNKQTSTIVSSYASTTGVNFYGGGQTYNNLTLDPTGVATGACQILGSNTFNTVNVVTLGRTLKLEAGTTNSFNNLIISGKAGTQSILSSTSGGVAANVVYTGSSKIRLDYMSVRDITGSVANVWYMGGNSTDGGNNTNIYFSNPPLYWIGGSGNWDIISTANWSYSSGGSSAGYVPDFATDVYFDSNSDTGAPFTVTVAVNAVCQSLTASGLDNTMTLGGSAGLAVYGNLFVPATNFTQSYTGTISFLGVGTFTITTNGKTFTSFNLNKAGGTWSLQSALTLSGALTLTDGSLDLGSGYDVTCDTFSAGTLADGIYSKFGGAGSYFYITSSAATTVWDISGATGLTVYNNNINVQLTGGGSTTKTIHNGITTTSARYVNFEINCTAGTVTFTANNQIGSLTIANNSITFANVALNIYGSFTISGANPTLTAGGSLITFLNPVGTATITTAGKNLDFPITFNGAGTFSLQDALSIGTTTTRNVTLTNGTIELNSYTMTIYGAFSSSNSNVRRIQMSGTGGKIVITTDTATTIWSTATSTNMTTDGNILVQTTGGGATVKTVNAGSLSETDAISFRFSTTAGTISFGPSTFKNLTIDNNSFTFQGNVSANILTIYGNLLISGTNPTLTDQTGALIFATSGTQTITTNGATINRPITFSGTGTYTLGGALAINPARAVLYSSGTLNLNSYTFTVGTIELSGSSSRTIAHGSNGTIAVSGSGDFAFNANGSNITYSGLGTINMLSASTKRFIANGNSFAILNQGGTGTLEVGTYPDIAGVPNATFYSIRNTTISNTTVNFQWKEPPGTVFTFTNNFELSGSNSTNIVTIGTYNPSTIVLPLDSYYITNFKYTNTPILNLTNLKVVTGGVKATPNNKFYARSSEYDGTFNDYNNTVLANGGVSNTGPGNGWVFVNDNGFFSSFM